MYLKWSERANKKLELHQRQAVTEKRSRRRWQWRKNLRAKYLKHHQFMKEPPISRAPVKRVQQLLLLVPCLLSPRESQKLSGRAKRRQGLHRKLVQILKLLQKRQKWRRNWSAKFRKSNQSIATTSRVLARTVRLPRSQAMCPWNQEEFLKLYKKVNMKLVLHLMRAVILRQ